LRLSSFFHEPTSKVVSLFKAEYSRTALEALAHTTIALSERLMSLDVGAGLESSV
jgi:hypothetical protein